MKNVNKKEKGLTAASLTMMAVGTVVGGSFFLGSAVAIHTAGPGVVIAYILGGALVYFILRAISEMTVENTARGSFRVFAAKAFGNGTGFVVGWVYFIGLALGMSSEATAVSILVRSWLPQLPIAFLGSTIIITVTLLNLLGADKLSKLESGLAAVKLFAVVLFIVTALALISGLFPGGAAVGIGAVKTEPFLPGGIVGIAGSMLVIMFAYSGFEIIGLAASEAREPRKTVPKAIKQTVFILVGLYVLSAAVMLPLIPTSQITTSISPMVAALDRHGIGWAGTALNIVLITAILSTMLATIFGLGRVFRSLADDGLAPSFLKDRKDVPYRGILFSGAVMLIGLFLGFLFPSVYLFLLSSGGFAILFTYAVIMASHIRFRRTHGFSSEKYKTRGFPVASAITLAALIISIISMPFVPGQESGLFAGIIMVFFFAGVYAVMKAYRKNKVPGKDRERELKILRARTSFSAETAKEPGERKKKKKKR